MKPRFVTKVDTWIAVVLVIAPVFSLIAGVSAILSGAILSGAFPIALIALVYGGLVWPIAYELDGDALVIRFGLARSRVRYEDIVSVRPTNSIISSPALSLDRLCVERRGRLGVNISPADKQGFLRALAERAPHLRVDDDSLVPAK